MKKFTLALLSLLASLEAAALGAQGSKYPPLAEYLMTRDTEIELARSAAPAAISDRATIKILTKAGYEVAREGNNGVVCMVMRGFSAPTYTPAQFRDLVYDPTVHAPICFTPPARGRTRSLKVFRRRMSKASSRGGTQCPSRTCGPRTSISDRASRLGTRT